MYIHHNFIYRNKLWQATIFTPELSISISAKWTDSKIGTDPPHRQTRIVIHMTSYNSRGDGIIQSYNTHALCISELHRWHMVSGNSKHRIWQLGRHAGYQERDCQSKPDDYGDSFGDKTVGCDTREISQNKHAPENHWVGAPTKIVDF